MKIGILTFHRALNYGAFLQAFALLDFIKSLGFHAEVIDYWPSEHKNVYSLFSFSSLKEKKLVAKVKALMSFLLGVTRACSRKRKMEILQKKFLGIQNKIQFPNNRDLAALHYDYIVYGSDQIWWKWNNLPDGKRDWVYWGDFIPKTVQKISYAASMGVINVDEAEKQQIACKLENFKSISVRERNLQSFIQSLTLKNVSQTIDPVFFKTKEEWLSLAKEPKITEKYVLLFNLMKSEDVNIFAKQKALELKCKIIEVTPSVQPRKIGKNVFQSLDAFEFIGMIKNAELVVTSSFHCVAFSIILKKQFFAVGMKNNSERVKALLDKLHIKERYLSTLSDCATEKIDYDKVDIILNQFILFSKNFLINAIEPNG